MGVMSEISIEIQEMLMEGYPEHVIAQVVGVPINWVLVEKEELFECTEPNDGFMTDSEADANALANIGWGTDEDYGYYGDEA